MDELSVTDRLIDRESEVEGPRVTEIERELQRIESTAELLDQLVSSAYARFDAVLGGAQDKAMLAERARVSPDTTVGTRISRVGDVLDSACNRLSELIDRCEL